MTSFNSYLYYKSEFTFLSDAVERLGLVLALVGGDHRQVVRAVGLAVQRLHDRDETFELADGEDFRPV
jgi:hypothetical protein